MDKKCNRNLYYISQNLHNLPFSIRKMGRLWIKNVIDYYITFLKTYIICHFLLLFNVQKVIDVHFPKFAWLACCQSQHHPTIFVSEERKTCLWKCILDSTLFARIRFMGWNRKGDSWERKLPWYKAQLQRLGTGNRDSGIPFVLAFLCRDTVEIQTNPWETLEPDHSLIQPIRIASNQIIGTCFIFPPF